MTPLAQHKLIEKILWAFKIPEVALTIVLVPGVILFLLGTIDATIPLYAFLLRVTLLFVRLGIVKVKRNLEKKYNIPRVTYVPGVVTKGARKVESVKRM